MSEVIVSHKRGEGILGSVDNVMASMGIDFVA